MDLTELDTLLNSYCEYGDVPELSVPATWNPQYSLYPFQRVGAAHLITKKRFILGDPTGSGKTPQCLYAWALVMEARASEGKMLKQWVVTTKSATIQWEEESHKFLPYVETFRVPSSKPKKKRLVVYEACLASTSPCILISNWDQLRRDWTALQETFGVEWLPTMQFTMDEAQKIKTPESLTGTVAREILEKVDRAHALTATLVQNRAHDAWAVVAALQPNIMDCKQFEKLYCHISIDKIWIGNRFRHVKNFSGYHHLDEFRTHISTIYLGREDHEIQGQRPDVVHKTYKVDFDAYTQQAYNTVERGRLLEDTDSVVGAMQHAQQMANAPTTFQDREKLDYLDWNRIKSNKLSLLKELLEDELKDTPVILYSQMETTVSIYERELAEYNPVRITGVEEDAARAEAQRKFQEGETNIILITDAGGEALNLQRAKAVVFISRPWSPGKYIQVVGRARRTGSEHEFILIIHLTCIDTVDEFVDSILGSKWGAVEDICRGRGNLMPDDEILPVEISEFARTQRRKAKRGEST